MRKNNFDFLRFIFAFIVVVGHIIVITKVEAFQVLKPYFSTYTSVTAFYCISGFLIFSSYSNTSSIKRYFAKRASRILPAYLLVIALSAILFSTISTLPFYEYFHSMELYKYLAANLVFLNFLHPDLPGVFTSNNLTPDINGALWTLKIEVSFYLLIPFLVYLFRKTRFKAQFLIVIYTLSVIYRNTLEMIASSTNDRIYELLARQLPGFMSYFICGIAVFLYFEQFMKYKNRLFVLAIVANIIERYLAVEIFTPLSLSIIVFTLAFSIKQLNGFAKYGDISYGIYIFHCPIIKTISYFGFFKQYNPFMVATLVILIVIMMGFLSWHFVEKGFLARSRNPESNLKKNGITQNEHNRNSPK